MSSSTPLTADWIANHWRRLPQDGRLAAYRAGRRLLRGTGLGWEVEIHHVIAVAPWRLRLPPRLARGLSVRELEADDVEALERLRTAHGTAYRERFAQAHRCVGAWLEERLVAFVWMRLGPGAIPSSFGCVWQLPAATAWLYDLYSDPAVLGAVPHLYAFLRQHAPGTAVRQFVGQTDYDNMRSRWSHRSLGYEVRATLWSAHWRNRHLHLSRGGQPRRWRWHRGRALIPLHLLTNGGEAAAVGGSAAGAAVRLQCECGREVAMAAAPGEGMPAAGERFRCRCGRDVGGMSAGVAVVGPIMPYWGEIPQAEMATVLARAGQMGWRAAVQESLPADLLEYVAAAGRADFHEVLPLPAGARVLDVGAGWGGIAANLAQRYTVVALEGVAERARFIALRRQQDGLDRLTVIQGMLHAPLAPRQFDAIIVNGVLEWVALMDLSVGPKLAQLLFLHRLRELLVPGGMIYLAIENRCGWAELRGERDHSGLPYTSLLPRPLARWVCARSRGYRAQFNVGYRTYTYTHRGYADLFAQVGLRIQETWISPGGYNHPQKLVPLHTGAIRFARRAHARAGVRAAAQHFLARATIWRWLGSDFIFLLCAEPPRMAAARRWEEATGRGAALEPGLAAGGASEA